MAKVMAMETKKENAAAAGADGWLGVQFEPGDAMLMGYLKGKVSCGGRIHEFDLYGVKEPWEIWDLFGGRGQEHGQEQEQDDLYFFTRLKKKYQSGSIIDRSVGSGTWMSEAAGKPITYSGRLLGFKKMFLHEDGVAEQVGGWIMHQCTLHANVVEDYNLGYVLCRLRKNDREAKRRKLIAWITTSELAT